MEIEIESNPIRYSNYKGGRLHRELATQWERLEFIAWDGEGTQPQLATAGRNSFAKKDKRTGRTVSVMIPNPIEEVKALPQPYVLFGNNKGNHIINEDGLATRDCFELLLEQKREYPNSIFVGFSINYDINQMLKDVPERILKQLYEHQEAFWQGYKIQWYPGKWLYLKHKTRRVRIFDVFGFFQSSFVTACEKYLGRDDPIFKKVVEGKKQRSVFSFKDIDYIIEYYSSELILLVELMNALRRDLHSAGINLSSWHGPGAVASTVFKQFNIKLAKEEPPPEVNSAAQYAYAGGRFEQFYCGRYSNTVYEYDINSAYPSAITRLPNLRKGVWEATETFDPTSYGVWFVDYNEQPTKEPNDKPQPLFCRNKAGLITYPYEVKGWYWTPEASLVEDRVQHGFVFKENGERPFAFVKEMYEKRRQYKREGNSTERALKLALNSMYGKMAQRIGHSDGIPVWHQLEWAGYITSYTRAKIYNAALQKPNAVLAIETDALFSLEPLDLPISSELGEWEESVFSEVTYLQSGFYYAVEKDSEKVICKYRGLDKAPNSPFPNNLSYNKILKELKICGGTRGRGFSLRSNTTRFNGLGLALNTHAVWRAWETNARYLAIGGDEKGSKRTHGKQCPTCLKDISMYDELHPCKINGYSGESFPHSLPWLTEQNEPQAMDYELIWQ